MCFAVLQFVLAPVLLWKSFVSTLLANALYMVALSYYHYLSFLGYSALPFLEHTEVCPIALHRAEAVPCSLGGCTSWDERHDHMSSTQSRAFVQCAPVRWSLELESCIPVY